MIKNDNTEHIKNNDKWFNLFNKTKNTKYNTIFKTKKCFVTSGKKEEYDFFKNKNNDMNDEIPIIKPVVPKL